MTYAQVLHRVAVVHLTGGHVLTAAADTVQAHEGHTLPSLGRLVRREVAAAAVGAARAAPHTLWAVEVPLAASGGRPPLLRVLLEWLAGAEKWRVVPRVVLGDGHALESVDALGHLAGQDAGQAN